ncbi:tetraacyldisaccharide 4'-kinase [Lysobacter helvus]|uniref:Tetraacyldisaccharide 4'-kinase n=2 Tax=Lysobacteraceae TaxID=32033 RepID=A0ABN6FX45_9GAMM|nr:MULTISPECIES: tetraacyldisaccharide 4'-kinase [Lysobacter]BCT93509.1 tetraacyldisaccharide 4'-kinase [Lysobacter caseinilyticus]BCT96662.1 tetraacyldisaccharide 4'-kinase [Lysobacter helvus]
MTKARLPAWWFDNAPVPLIARAVSSVYGDVTRLRRGLYSRHLLRQHRVPVPVVVVGNIAVGGTGKTPLTIAIVERLRDAGWTPGVASRGHGRREERTPRWVERNTSPDEGGDEPVLIAMRTGAKVRVDRDRVAAARALAQAGCDIVVCDDGLQHYRLARDVEIDVADGRRGRGNGQLLPAGPLREPIERAMRCDFRVVNVGAGGDGEGIAGFGEWPMQLVPGDAHPLVGGRPRPLASFAGQRVHAVAGIGNPDRFFAMLRDRGIAVVPHAFSDHHVYVAADFEFGSKLPVLMTEKDAVKCRALADADFHSVPVRAELPEAFWIALLDRLPPRTQDTTA